MKEPCPCCGHQVFEEKGRYEICPICYWEDDYVQSVNPDTEGANTLTLREAQLHFMEFGACDRESIKHVRKPKKHEKKHSSWKSLHD